jgi:hypothetical protein
MRQSIWLLIFVFLVLGSRAQENKNVESEIRRLEQICVKAILEGDTLTLKKIWAPEFMVNTPRNDIAADRDAVFVIQKNGMINYSSFTRTIEKIQFHDLTVITMGFEIYLPNQAGQKEIKRRFLNVWMNKNGEWQQVARQASIICQ